MARSPAGRTEGPAMGMPAYTRDARRKWEGFSWFPYYRPGSGELAEAVSEVICRRDSSSAGKSRHGGWRAKPGERCWPPREV
ncbi:MAG: hypothetical protein ACLR0U_18245 [Enterocloster clostridioformis]